MSDINPEDYSCEILLEKTTPEKAKNSSFPTDAYNVTYTVAVSYTHLTLPTTPYV